MLERVIGWTLSAMSLAVMVLWGIVIVTDRFKLAHGDGDLTMFAYMAGFGAGPFITLLVYFAAWPVIAVCAMAVGQRYLRGTRG